jgi:hypothetical protein
MCGTMLKCSVQQYVCLIVRYVITKNGQKYLLYMYEKFYYA